MVALGLQVDMEENAKSDGFRSATTTSSPRRKLRSETTVMVVDGSTSDEVEKLLQYEKCVSKVPPLESKRHPNGKVKLKYLNGLRGVASVLVVHHHAGYLSEVTLGPSSVDLFFVLSAFLLTMINEAKIRKLIAHKASAREWVVRLVDYFVKRLMRVYPLFACVAIVLTCMPEATRTRYYNLSHYNIQSWSLWDILTFNKRYYLLWTLPIEITYYFMIPLLLVGHCYLDKVAKAKWPVIGLLYVWVYYEGWHTKRTQHDKFRPHLPVFLAGSLAAVVYLELNKWMKKNNFEPSNWQIAVIRAFEATMLSVMISDVCGGLLKRWFHGSLFPSNHPAVPSVSLPISAVIVIEALAPSAISRVLEWNALCFTGKISFSMYLLHPFVNFLPWLIELPRVDQFIVRLVLVYALATASFFLIENNSQILAVVIGKKISRSIGQQHADKSSPERLP